MSDENSDYLLSKGYDLLKLGYLIQNNNVQPFSLSLNHLRSLFIIGERAQDIYYNLFFQLCDEQPMPILVITNDDSSSYEEQMCVNPIWRLDLSHDYVSCNPLNMRKPVHPSRQISILVNLFCEFSPLSRFAKDLLHIIIWKALITLPKPTLQDLASILYKYRNYRDNYNELCNLFDALPEHLLRMHFDNITLRHLRRLPTIISVPEERQSMFIVNVLLLKLIAQRGGNLPPLFIFDVPPLHPSLMRWLCTRYLGARSPLVIFDSEDVLREIDSRFIRNLIITNQSGSASSPLQGTLTQEELQYLHDNDDYVAVKLQNESATRFVTIF